MFKKLSFIFLITIIFVLTYGCQMEKNPSSAVDVKNLYLYIEEEDLEELYSRDPLSDDRIKGIIKLSPQDSDEKKVEVRFRGDSTRFLPKKSFNIRFEEKEDFIFQSNRMNLNASYLDPTLMREKLSMDMFHHLGLIAPRTQYFNLYINDIYEGLYLHLERIDQNLLQNFGLNPNGTLVRDRFTRNLNKEEINRPSVFGYNLRDVENPEKLLKENFEYRGNPDWQEIVQLATWVYETPEGEDFYKAFKKAFYLEDFIDWFAIHLLIGDMDSFADDYWLYKNHDDPKAKWRVIPWDKDLTFGSAYRIDAYVDNDYFAYEYDLYRHGHRQNLLITKFLATPQLRQKLFDRMEFLMEEVFTLEYFKQRIENIRLAIEESATTLPGEEAFLIHPQNHHGELGRYPYHLETLLDFIELRYRFLHKQIYTTDNSRYIAKKDISSYKEKDTVYFTDDMGWTIAKLYIEEIITPGPMSIRVDQHTGIKGIDRIWTIDARNVEIIGDLTLYYRNDISGYGRNNWYEEDTPVGNQWNLTIGQYKQGEIKPLISRVNPYSNKVTTSIPIKGITQLVITEEKEQKSWDLD